MTTESGSTPRGGQPPPQRPGCGPLASTPGNGTLVGIGYAGVAVDYGDAGTSSVVGIGHRLRERLEQLNADLDAWGSSSRLAAGPAGDPGPATVAGMLTGAAASGPGCVAARRDAKVVAGVRAPSTLGTLRSHSPWGPVRQLDAVNARLA